MKQAIQKKSRVIGIFIPTLSSSTVRRGSISFCSYLADGKGGASTPSSLAAQIHQLISALFVAQTGRAGCALLQAGGEHLWACWGAFGAVNPSSGLVANSQGVGEEEQLECLQPSQLHAV